MESQATLGSAAEVTEVFTYGLGPLTTCLIREVMVGTGAALQKLGKKELQDGLSPFRLGAGMLLCLHVHSTL